MKVIVTGASQGIGRGIALELARQGCAVGGLARSEAGLSSLESEIRNAGGVCVTAPCDLREPENLRLAIASLMERLGGVDGLINNAGLVIRKSVFDLTDEEWRAMVDTNIGGMFHASRAVLGTMRAQGHGHIINVSSISGRVPLPGGSAYAATKFAVTGFSQSLLYEVRDFGVKVTILYPGSVASGSERHGDADEGWKVTPEEVGRACWDVLNTRAQNLVSELEIRPLRKPQNL